MDVLNKLSSLQEISKMQLSKIFSSNSSRKFLVLEPTLIKPMEKVCGVQWLKGSGVEKIFKLEPQSPPQHDNPIFYMIPTDFKIFSRVVDQIRGQVDIDNPPSNKYHVIVVPQVSHIFQEELEQYGLFDVVKLYSYQWMPLHLDKGLLSLEIPYIYRNLFVYENHSLLPSLSKSLWQLIFVVGEPNLVITLGSNSAKVWQHYERVKEFRGKTDDTESDFGALLIVDRSADYAGALLTPGIYSGLLSEVYTVKAGTCDYKAPEDPSAVDDKCIPIYPKKSVTLTLNSGKDSVYAGIKNRYFTEVTSVLSGLTKELKNEKLNSQNMGVEEMKRYVKHQLQATRLRKNLITNHLLAAESIINVVGHRYERQKHVETNIMKNTGRSSNLAYLEEITTTENNMLLSLRLFCLLCITQLPSEGEVRSFWTKFLQQFGFTYGFALNNLMDLGFVTTTSNTSKLNLKMPKFSPSNFYVNVKNFKQIPQDPDVINLKHPTCASYVFGGAYTPLIVQVAGMILNSVPFEDIISKLEGVAPVTVKNNRAYPLLCRNLLIFMIGGVSYAEIAACNLLEVLLGARIVVMSDRVINGNDIVQDILSPPG